MEMKHGEMCMQFTLSITIIAEETCKNYNAFRLSISYRLSILQNRYSEGAGYSYLFAGNTYVQAE